MLKLETRMVCSVRVRARVWVGGGGWGAREGRRCGSARQMDGRVSCSQERPTATQGVVAVCFASTDDDVGGMLRELCNGSASAVEQSVIRVAVPPCDDHAAMQGAENVFRIRPCGRKRWSRAPRRAPVVAAALSQRRSRHWPPMRRRSRRAQNAELCWRQAGKRRGGRDKPITLVTSTALRRYKGPLLFGAAHQCTELWTRQRWPHSPTLSPPCALRCCTFQKRTDLLLLRLHPNPTISLRIAPLRNPPTAS